jgi:hypothetical protein
LAIVASQVASMVGPFRFSSAIWLAQSGLTVRGYSIGASALDPTLREQWLDGPIPDWLKFRGV